jgi:hypothetical protein
MLSDKQIETVAREIDNLLGDLAIKHQIGPLSLSGIIIARLIHFANNDENLYKLFSEVGAKTHLQNSEVVH